MDSKNDPMAGSVLGDPRALLESTGDANFALDAEWRIVYANGRALAFWNATGTASSAR